MKVLHLIYDVEFEPMVHAVLHRGMAIPRYTRLNDITGARVIELEHHADYKMDLKNRMVVVIAPALIIDKLVHEFKELRARLKHGIRGYVTSAEQII